jgi:hypothetical protein
VLEVDGGYFVEPTGGRAASIARVTSPTTTWTGVAPVRVGEPSYQRVARPDPAGGRNTTT